MRNLDQNMLENALAAVLRAPPQTSIKEETRNGEREREQLGVQPPDPKLLFSSLVLITLKLCSPPQGRFSNFFFFLKQLF